MGYPGKLIELFLVGQTVRSWGLRRSSTKAYVYNASGINVINKSSGPIPAHVRYKSTIGDGAAENPSSPEYLRLFEITECQKIKYFSTRNPFWQLIITIIVKWGWTIHDNKRQITQCIMVPD